MKTTKEILDRTERYIKRLQISGDEYWLIGIKEMWQLHIIKDDAMIQILDEVDGVCFRCSHGVDNVLGDCQECEELITKTL